MTVRYLEEGHTAGSLRWLQTKPNEPHHCQHLMASRRKPHRLSNTLWPPTRTPATPSE